MLENIFSLASGELFHGRYQILKELGRNAGRRTLLAQDSQTQQRVVIKIITFNKNFRWEDLKLFEREVETLKSLSHPAIPHYLDYFDFDTPSLKGFALVQNYIDAISLQEYIKTGRTFSENEVKQLAKSLLSVLSYLHSHEPPIIHRDIKPSNILLANRSAHNVGDIYLVDFGSVQTATRQNGTITIVGTYGYMPPEQFGGKAFPASDLYGLGATLIYLMTGTEPSNLPQEDLQIKFEEIANISPEFTAWLKLITHPSLKERFESTAKALLALESENLLSSKSEPLVIKKPSGSNIFLRADEDSLQIEIPYRKKFIANNNNPDLEFPLLLSILKWLRFPGIFGFWTIFFLMLVILVISVLSIIAYFAHWTVAAFLAASVMINWILSGKENMKLPEYIIMNNREAIDKLKDIKEIHSINVDINQHTLELSLTYLSTYGSRKLATYLKSSVENITQLTCKKTSYKFVVTKSEQNINSIERQEAPAILYLRVKGHKYGLGDRLTQPERDWLAQEISEFLDIPINWE
jgi:serine/threonine protein kinase